MKTINKNANYMEIKNNLNADFLDLISLPVIICTRKDYRTVYANDASVKFYGYSKKELGKLAFPDLLDSAGRSNKSGEYFLPVNLDMTKIIQIHRTKKNGPVKVEVILQKILFEKEETILVLINEIIDSKRYEDKVNEYAAILESTDDAAVGKTLEGIITSWNSGAEKMYGYKASEAIGRSVEMIIPKEKIEEFREIMKNIKSGQKINHYRTKRIKKDGTKITISVTISPIYSIKGNLVGASSIAKDITKDILTENLMLENEERMKIALSAGRMGTWDWRFPSNSIVWDDYMYKIFGLNKGEFSGKFEDFLQLVYPDDRERVHDSVESAIEKNIPYESEYRIVRGDNDLRYITARGKLIKDDSLTPFRFIGICQDITDQKNNELEKERLMSQEKKMRQKTENIKNRLSFLVDSSRLLASSTDYESTLKSVARAVVPVLGDICAIDLADDNGSIKRVEVVYRNPDNMNLFSELKEKYKASADFIKEVIRTGKSKSIFSVDEKFLKKFAADKKHLDFLLSLNIKSLLIVPLKSKEKIYGSLSIVMSDSGRYYITEDLVIAEELAHRAAAAIENAKLYRKTRLSNEELEKLVKEKTAENELLKKKLKS